VSVDQVSADVGAEALAANRDRDLMCLSIRSVLTSAPGWLSVAKPDGPVCLSIRSVLTSAPTWDRSNSQNMNVSVDQVSADVGARIKVAGAFRDTLVSVDQVSADVGALNNEKKRRKIMKCLSIRSVLTSAPSTRHRVG